MFRCSSNKNYARECSNLGKNLKFLRNKKELTLAALSAKLPINISRNSLGYYECGYCKMSPERLEIFAEFYKLERSEDLYMDHNDFIKKYGV